MAWCGNGSNPTRPKRLRKSERRPVGGVVRAKRRPKTLISASGYTSREPVHGRESEISLLGASVDVPTATHAAYPYSTHVRSEPSDQNGQALLLLVTGSACARDARHDEQAPGPRLACGLAVADHAVRSCFANAIKRPRTRDHMCGPPCRSADPSPTCIPCFGRPRGGQSRARSLTPGHRVAVCRGTPHQERAREVEAPRGTLARASVAYVVLA